MIVVLKAVYVCRYAADKLTELVTAALDAGADAGTLAGLQVAAPPHASLM